MKESAASSTSVVGNYIGVNAGGTAAVPNADAGVNVGEAPHTLVGGPSARDANRINGGSVGVLAGPEAGDLAVRGNLIGTDAIGGGTLTPPDDGIVVDSGELESPALEAEIVDNEIGMEGGDAILQHGRGAWIHGNQISGAQTGIKTVDPIAYYGNVVEGNRIDGSAGNGILVENDFNEIVGNEIVGAGGPGIWIQGMSRKQVETLVGGDTAGDENVIDGSAGAAIEISNEEKTDNEVARNRGTGNGGLFIDLVANSPATEVGPNRGSNHPPSRPRPRPTRAAARWKAPRCGSSASSSSPPGSSSRSSAKRSPTTPTVGSVTYDEAIPAGTIIAATQTMEGATSELAMAGSGAEGSTGGAGGVFGGGAQGPFANAAPIRPQTRIVRGRLRHHSARFVFEANQAGSNFLCRLDDKPFDICRSPKRYMGLAAGKHVFWVRAVGPTGHVDLSPAKKKFAIPG